MVGNKKHSMFELKHASAIASARKDSLVIPNIQTEKHSDLFQSSDQENAESSK